MMIVSSDSLEINNKFLPWAHQPPSIQWSLMIEQVISSIIRLFWVLDDDSPINSLFFQTKTHNHWSLITETGRPVYLSIYLWHCSPVQSTESLITIFLLLHTFIPRPQSKDDDRELWGGEEQYWTGIVFIYLIRYPFNWACSMRVNNKLKIDDDDAPCHISSSFQLSSRTMGSLLHPAGRRQQCLLLLGMGCVLNGPIHIRKNK